MPLLDETRASKLIELAEARFDPKLAEVEMKFLRDSACSSDPLEPEKDQPRPEVRSEFVRWLATDPETVQNIDPKGLRVWGVTLPGNLDLDECRVSPTLYIHRCTIRGDINLMFAETRGVYVTESEVAGPIKADGIKVHGPVSLRGSKFASEIRMLGASVESEFSCTDTKLASKGDALSLDNAEIGNNVFLNNGFESCGTIRMLGAHIAGNLECEDANLKAEGIALTMDEARIDGGAFFRDGFQSSGAIRLPVAEINGDLEFWDVEVAEVYCRNLKLAGDFIWQQIRNPEKSTLKLIGARVRSLRDDSASWPAAGNLKLGGLVYEDLISHKTSNAEDLAKNRFPDENELSAVDRIKWLMLQARERQTEPQPWMQLRDLLESKGDHRGAKHVIYKLRCLQARKYSAPLRRWKIAFAWLEEAPGRIWRSIAVVLLLGTLIFGLAGARGALAPTDPETYRAFTAGKPMPASYPVLNPFVYTLENAVPMVKLGQDDKWAPDRRHPGKAWFTNYWILVWARWMLILSGWFQATVLAAALSGRFKE